MYASHPISPVAYRPVVSPMSSAQAVTEDEYDTLPSLTANPRRMNSSRRENARQIPRKPIPRRSRDNSRPRSSRSFSSTFAWIADGISWSERRTAPPRETKWTPEQNQGLARRRTLDPRMSWYHDQISEDVLERDFAEAKWEPTLQKNVALLDMTWTLPGLKVANDPEAMSVAGVSIATQEQQWQSSPFSLAMIVLALVCSIFLVALDMTIIATAIPSITEDFKSLDQLGWYGSAFFLTTGGMQACWGKIFKYTRLKISFLVSMLIFEIGSLICGVAPNSTALIVGRAVAGAGAAGIASGAYIIIAFSAPPKQRPLFTGIMGATFGLASVLGPLLGGVFTDSLSWRWCFYINLPIGAVAATIIVLSFKASVEPEPATWKEILLQLDVPGTFTLLAAIVCFLLATQWGGTTKSWSDPAVIVTLVFFGLLIGVFVAIEYYSGERALLQGRLMRDRTIIAMSVFQSINAGAFFTLLYFLPLYFQTTRNVSASQSGINNIPLVLGASLFSVISGGLLAKWGRYIPIMVCGTAILAVGCGLIYSLDISTPSREWISYQAVAGIGIGLIFQIPMIVCQATVQPSDISSISAIILFFQSTCGALVISAAQAGFTNTLIKAVGVHVPGLDPYIVIATGASELRDAFTAEQLPGVLAAYLEGLRVPFILCVACACVTFLVSFTPRWGSIKGASVAGAA